MLRIGNEKWNLSRKPQKLANKSKNYEKFVAKKKIEQDKQELMSVYASREGSYNCESVIDSSEFLVRCERILRS